MHDGRRIVVLIWVAFLAAGCEAGGERVMLPFRNVVADVDLTLPAGVMAVGCGDGSFVGESCFDPPVHPIGEVRTLSIEGHDIAVADTKLVDGMLRTKEFGQFEFSVSRFDPSSGKSFDILVTERQIRKLEGLVGARPVEAGAQSDSTALPKVYYQVQTDGIYVASLGEQDSYLRFWQGGPVVEVLAPKSSDPKEVVRRLTPGKGGSWLHLNEFDLHINSVVEGKSYEYVGRIEPGGKKLIMTRDDGVALRYAEFDYMPMQDLP